MSSDSWQKTVSVLTIFTAFSLAGCAREKRLIVNEIPSPAPAGSVEPNLTVSDEGVLLSWEEPAEHGRALKFCRRVPHGWTAPQTVYSGTRSEDSPAEVPSVVASGGNRLDAVWTEVSRDTPKEYQEDVFTSTSSDGGNAWSHPQLVNQDHTVSEHGYVSLATTPEEAPAVLWLDGSDDKTQHRYRLRTAALGSTPDQQKVLDDDVCTCCPTAMVRTLHGLIAAYRDHTADNIRDISVVRRVKGQWTTPIDVAHDNWHIDGCPTNGPALATDGKRVALAWFTAAADRPEVKLSFSSDEGASWTAPIVVSEAPPVGRATVALFPDGSALVGWVSVSNGTSPALLARRVTEDAKLGPVLAIANAKSVRGRIKLAAARGEMLITWVEEGPIPQLRTASIEEQ